MSRLAKIVLSAVLVSLMVISVALPLRFDITSPRLGAPVVLSPGQEFRINLKTSIPFWRPDLAVKISLSASPQPLSLSVSQFAYGLSEQVITSRIPEKLIPGNYDLTLTANGLSVTRHHAVHVVTQEQDRMSIVQIADLPPLGGDEKGDQSLRQIINEINIINPTVVMLTGDIAYGGSWDQYQRLTAILRRLDAPVVAGPGNHEYEGWAGYLTSFGSPYHYEDVLGFRIISLNSAHGRDQITLSQYRWLESTLSTAGNKIPIIQLHHPLMHRADLGGVVRGRVEEIVDLFNRHHVLVVLSGHWHGDAVYDEQGNERIDKWDFSGTPYVVTTTAGADLRPKYSSSPMHYGYRLIKIDNGLLQHYTYDYDGDGERDPVSSIPIGLLALKYKDANTVVVNNALNETLLNAKIKFTIKQPHKLLTPSVGRIARRYNLQRQTIYEVTLDLPARSSTKIRMQSKDQTQ
jgi:hypothetical protein